MIGFIIAQIIKYTREENGMNRFVEMYKDSVSRKLSFETRDFYFQITAKVIAEFGTIEDLKALIHYYENETEEMKNESITAAV